MCHIPLSCVFFEAVGTLLGLVLARDGCRGEDETFAAASGSFASGFFASARCAASEVGFDFAKSKELVGMEVPVEVKDSISVEVENEVTHFEVGTLVKAWLLRGTVDDDVGISIGLTTMYDATVVGEGVIVTS